MPTKRPSPRSSQPSRRSRGSRSYSVIGSHAAPSSKPSRTSRGTGQGAARRSGRVAPGSHARPRRSGASLRKRTGEINQVDVPTRSVDQRTNQHAGSRSRAQEFMKQRRRKNIIIAAVAIIVAAFLIFNIASCAFRTFASATMALNDEGVQNELVAQKDNEPYTILLVGLSNSDTSMEAASFIAALRVDEANKRFSLMNIPNNIMVSVDPNHKEMLRNMVRLGGEARLVQAVKEQTGLEFSHYLRITEEGLVRLVDDIGGVEVNVEYRVDDPRVGHVVVAPGQQNLNGEQALAFISATNYKDGRTQRMNNQLALFFELLNKLTSAEGLSRVSDSDVVSNAIKTDMSYDALSALANIYAGDATFDTATMPGAQYAATNNEVFFGVSAKVWSVMKERFLNAEATTSNVDISGVQKDQLTIIVQNGSGTDGFAAQAAQILEQHGYTIQETGNADSFVYKETLVIYKEEKDEAAAQAIVADLGIGRAVYASVYYSLKTDIQVVVGQDWKPVG